MVPLLASACALHSFPETSSEEYPLDLGSTVEVRQVNGFPTSVFAAASGSADVRCESWPAGSPERSRPLVGHYEDAMRTVVPIERGGTEFYPVGTVPVSENRRAAVTCDGPAGTEVVVISSRPAS